MNLQLTPSQQAILDHTGNKIIEATAGAGKTYSLLEYAKKHNDKRVLYLAFNKSVQEEGFDKIKKMGLRNTHVYTAHSLAYRSLNVGRRWRQVGFVKTLDLVKFFNLDEREEESYYSAQHINNVINYFCMSDLDSIEEAAKEYHKQYSYIDISTKKLTEKVVELYDAMLEGKMTITHNFYLKQYQLSKPKLNYDIILFDEIQDANPVMLDIFMSQDHAEKVGVGDENQAIYGWNNAVNGIRMLKEIGYDVFPLMESFRFPQGIADRAMETLKLKKLLDPKYEVPNIIGRGKESNIKTTAIIGRSNMSLLEEIIEMFVKSGQFAQYRNFYYEGGFKNSVIGDNNISLYDILYLYMDKKDSIRDPHIKSFKTFDSLETYAEEVRDNELFRMIRLVTKYSTNLFSYIRDIKSYEIDDKKKADVVFSTAHKSKGLEYDSVNLKGAYISKKELEIYAENKGNYKKLYELKIRVKTDREAEEEVNCLYVALTRAKNSVVFIGDGV